MGKENGIDRVHEKHKRSNDFFFFLFFIIEIRAIKIGFRRFAISKIILKKINTLAINQTDKFKLDDRETEIYFMKDWRDKVNRIIETLIG